MAQGEACWCATGGAKAVQQGLFHRTLGRLGAGGVRQLPAEDFARAAIDDRHEGAPAVATAVHGGDVGGPALVGSCGDGLEVLHTRPAARAALPARPAVQAHDAVDLLAVDDHALAFGQAGMGHAHAVGGMRFGSPHEWPRRTPDRTAARGGVHAAGSRWWSVPRRTDGKARSQAPAGILTQGVGFAWLPRTERSEIASLADLISMLANPFRQVLALIAMSLF